MILVGLSGGIGQGKTTVGKLLRELAQTAPDCDLEFSYVLTDVINAWIAKWPLLLDARTNVVDLANQLILLLPPVLTEFGGKTITPETLQIDSSPQSQAANEKFIRYLDQRRSAGTQLSELFPSPINPENRGLHRDLFMWVGATAAQKIDGKFWGNIVQKRIQGLKAAGHEVITVGGIRSIDDAEMIHQEKGVVVRVMRPDTTVNPDTTERWMTEWQPDIDVYNNGTIEQLTVVVQQLLTDLKAGTPKKTYSAQA